MEELILINHPETGEIVLEEWVSIPNYEDSYMVSNYGRVTSLDKTVNSVYGSTREIKGKILKQGVQGNYLNVTLSKNNVKKTYSVHVLVAMGFLDYVVTTRNIVIDHKDNVGTNNHVLNLQIVSMRHNTSKNRKDNPNKSSKYVGVCFRKDTRKYPWQAQITINGKIKYLGSFKKEIDAHKAYQSKIKELL